MRGVRPQRLRPSRRSSSAQPLREAQQSPSSPAARRRVQDAPDLATMQCSMGRSSTLCPERSLRCCAVDHLRAARQAYHRVHAELGHASRPAKPSGTSRAPRTATGSGRTALQQPPKPGPAARRPRAQRIRRAQDGQGEKIQKGDLKELKILSVFFLTTNEKHIEKPSIK